MVVNLRAVFSHPAPEVTEVEYHDWYDFHAGRILTYDGFVGNRRYLVTPLRGSGSPAGYEYVSLYEIDRDPVDAHGPLRADVKGGTIDHPDWFRNLVRSSWNCYELDSSPSGWLFDRLYMVLTSCPPAVDQDSWAAAYGAYLDDHRRLLGVIAGGRFTLSPGTVDDTAPSTVSFLALYGAAGELDPASLVPDDGADGDGRFLVLECTALGPALRRSS